jgi:hypothetical protein
LARLVSAGHHPQLFCQFRPVGNRGLMTSEKVATA